MIRRLIYPIILFLLAMQASAQYNEMLLHDQSLDLLSITGTHRSGSNAINNSLFFDLRKGGYISPGTINQLERSLKKSNTLGGMTSVEMIMIYPQTTTIASDTFHWVGGIGYHQIQEARFSKNAAMLAMHGNLMFEGDSIQIAPLQYRNLRYEQYKAGLMKVSKNDKGRFYAGFTAGFALITDHLSVNVRNAVLYTAPMGEYLSLHSDMEISGTKAKGSSLFTPQGIGPTFDLFYAWIPVKGPSVSVSFTHLGFMMWNSRTHTYQKDTTYLFEGLLVENLFDISDAEGTLTLSDTLEKHFQKEGFSGSYFTSLPITFQLGISQKLKQYPIVLSGEFLYRHNTFMKPYLAMSIDWQAKERLLLSRTYSYGGYHGLASGVSVQWNPFGHWWLKIGSNALFPMISKESLMGIHVSGGLFYRCPATQKEVLP